MAPVVCTSDTDVKLEKARCRTPCDVETSIPHLILSQFQGRNARHIQHPTASGALLVIDKWAESKTTYSRNLVRQKSSFVSRARPYCQVVNWMGGA